MASPLGRHVSRPLWVVALILGCTTGRLSAESYAADVRPYHRLAILSTPELQRVGFADLVANALQQPDVQLVERDQLRDVLREQSLATLLGPSDGAQRTRLGRLINAQALIVMHDQGPATDRRIAVVLADCNLGARLSVDSLPASAPAQENAARIRARVDEIRARFAGGLKAVVGIPPFISHTFTYEYHSLQSGYAALLRDGLSLSPGVAVVEIAEARSIRRELELGGARSDAIWPAFIDGDFEVRTSTTEPAVNFTIGIQRAEGVRSIERHGLTLRESAAFVAHDLPREILSADSKPAPATFTPLQMFQALARRADSFAALGEFSQSISLRQAALVIDPDSADQHQKLSSECVAHVESLGTPESLPDAGADGETTTAKGLIDWESALESLEWQLHRSANPNGDKIRLVHRALVAINSFYRTNVAEEAQRSKRDFVLRIAALLNRPDWPGNSENLASALRAEWSRTLIESAARNYLGPLESEDYGLLEQLLNTELPPDAALPRAFTDLLCSDFNAPRQSFERADFLSKLAQSSRPQVRFLSKLATISARVRFEHARDTTVLKELDDLTAEYQAFHDAQNTDVTSAIPHVLETLRNTVSASRNRLVRPDSAAAQGPPGANPSELIEAGALRLQKVSLHIRLLNGTLIDPATNPNGPLPGLSHVLRCNDQVTVCWDQYHVLLMREAGTCEEILEADPSHGPDFADCRWDGMHLWLATLHHGVWQIDPSGTVLARIDAIQGLPPCEKGVRLAVLGIDRLMVAGAFGPTHRAFLAIVQPDKSGYRVAVIHKAPRVIEDQRSASDIADADLAFIPQQMAVCRARDGSGPFVVVRRSGATRGADSHPLIVDCQTLSVAVVATRIGPFPFLSCGGGILHSSDLQDELDLSHPTSDGRDLTADFPPLHFPRPGTSNSWAGAPSDAWAVAGDGQVYLMGKTWFRLDPRTWTACRLNDPEALTTSLHLGGLTHFGFVAWGTDASGAMSMYRVGVNEDFCRPVDNGGVK